ncbi:MAG TPA: glycoside hydrolase family 88 protein [Steroidobacteraceae bacterium]|nr:glycoside hydrolase family 88 protein [Steroidobacteraceae bacterium]
MHLASAAALALVFCAATATAQIPDRKQVLDAAARVADWQLARLDGTHITTHMNVESRDPRSWQQGAFWVGMTRLAQVSGEKRFIDAIHAQGERNAWKPGERVHHADDHVIAQSYLWAARHGADKNVLTPTRGVFDAILADPPVVHLSFYFSRTYSEAQCLRRWCWCDAIFMSPPAWLDLANQTGERKYRDYAMAEFWAATEFLYDPAEKLYFRDSRFFERRDEQGRKLFWSRGNGWVFAGIANMLELLPPNHADRPRLEALFKQMAARLKAVQKADGYWAPSLLGAENSPAETSGTGFFTYGLAWGVNRGLLPADDYRASVLNGWAALTRAVTRDGRLGWVQQVSDRPEQVAEADTHFYGVGAFLLAASELAVLR